MMRLILVLMGGALLASCGGDARRVRVRPVGGAEALEAPQQVEYYAEQEDDEGPVLVSRQDAYGRATGSPRLSPAKSRNEGHREPPVQTIRNYNKLNDDGSFTFGYEAADGSFKEETRGTDCVVRGKYGYIDPDGNKREFTYVSGNPCDPNAVEQEEEEEDSAARSGEEENIPKGFPIRRPIVAVKSRPPPPPPRPTTTVFHQDYNQGAEEGGSAEEEGDGGLRLLIQQRPRLQVIPQQRPTAVQLVQPASGSAGRVYGSGGGGGRYPVPTFAQLEEELRPQVLRTTTASPLGRPQTPTPVLLRPTPSVQTVQQQRTRPHQQQRPQQVAITPRPKQAELPATTYRPVIHVAPSTPKSTRPSSALSFEQEVKNFQLENNVVSTPSPNSGKKIQNQPIYTSELVFDPTSGQYNTVVYQQLPQTQGDFRVRGSLQPFVTPQYYRPRPPPPQALAPQYAAPSQQDLFQQQQAALVHQSQQLFAAQQQRKLSPKPPIPSSLFQQEPQRFSPAQVPPSPKPFAPSQPLYYVATDRGYGGGQIDAFLRGHQISI